MLDSLFAVLFLYPSGILFGVLFMYFGERGRKTVRLFSLTGEKRLAVDVITDFGLSVVSVHCSAVCLFFTTEFISVLLLPLLI